MSPLNNFEIRQISQLWKCAPYTPNKYWRFVDDIIGLLRHGEAALLKFHQAANAIHPRIQVTLRYSEDEIEFLDTLVRIENGLIRTSLYAKPTDQHIYVYNKSDHPKAVNRSITYGLSTRAKRICSDLREYRKEKKKIFNRMVTRGHRGKDVSTQL